jgi:hypothetical protein
MEPLFAVQVIISSVEVPKSTIDSTPAPMDVMSVGLTVAVPGEATAVPSVVATGNFADVPTPGPEYIKVERSAHPGSPDHEAAEICHDF